MPVKRSNARTNNTIELPSLDDMEAGEGKEFKISVGVDEYTPDAKDREDYLTTPWFVYIQLDTGWTYCDKVPRYPDPEKLRTNFGVGMFRLRPLDEHGREVESLEEVVRVGVANPTSPQHQEPVPRPKHPDDELPAWTQLLMQQATQEREEARRAQTSADKRRQEWERKQQEREWERQERQERQERERFEREEKERERKAEQMQGVMAQGAGILGSIVTAVTTAIQHRPQPEPRSDMSDKLLSLFIAQQNQPKKDGGMKETLDLLIVLDKMAENRASQVQPPKEDDDPMKTMMSMLPMIMAMKGGGGGAGGGMTPDQLQSMMGDSVRSAFRDPETIQRIAAENPDETAAAFMSAVKNNPKLEAAVVKALEDDATD